MRGGPHQGREGERGARADRHVDFVGETGTNNLGEQQENLGRAEGLKGIQERARAERGGSAGAGEGPGRAEEVENWAKMEKGSPGAATGWRVRAAGCWRWLPGGRQERM